MKFDIISIFPDFFQSPLLCGIVRIAQKKGIIAVNVIDPRSRARDGKVDDYQFGGGAGMVMKPEPLRRSIRRTVTKKSRLIALTPRGIPFDQDMAKALSQENHIVIVCGRYKGIDERVTTLCKPEEISIGDYVLSGGEVAALVLIEAITRLLPGALGNRDSAASDSFTNPLLEAPRYTRPSAYCRHTVPTVLRSGNHAHIARYRRKMAIEQTLTRRPDLLPYETFNMQDLDILLEVMNGKNS
jgi:tRNA (guanine37-N1)-methyltransferase